MSYAEDYASPDLFVSDATADARAAFIRRTYMHVGGAVMAFIGLEAIFLNTPAIYQPLMVLLAGNWWIVLIAFMAVSWVAGRWAQNGGSPGMQYAGLGLYVLAEAVIFVPILLIAPMVAGPEVVPSAGFLTAMIFFGLTAVVMLTKADFSFLRNVIWVCSFAALGLIFGSMIFGFTLGLVFTAAMVALMSMSILYQTSNIMHHYHTDQHVGAALALFASLATLFWYVLRLLMILSDD